MLAAVAVLAGIALAHHCLLLLEQNIRSRLALEEQGQQAFLPMARAAEAQLLAPSLLLAVVEAVQGALGMEVLAVLVVVLGTQVQAVQAILRVPRPLKETVAVTVATVAPTDLVAVEAAQAGRVPQQRQRMAAMAAPAQRPASLVRPSLTPLVAAAELMLLQQPQAME